MQKPYSMDVQSVTQKTAHCCKPGLYPDICCINPITASQLIKTFTEENKKMVVASHVKIYISATNTFLMEIPSFFNLRKWPLTYNRSCQVFCHSGDKLSAKFYRQSLEGLLTAIRSANILILVHCRVNFGQSQEGIMAVLLLSQMQSFK